MEKFVATAVEIMPLLWDRFGGYLRKDLLGVRILHKQGRCFLEITTRRGSAENPMQDEAVERIDLSFIGEMENQQMFPGHVSAFATAQKFVEEFNAYDIVCLTKLFTDEAAAFVLDADDDAQNASVKEGAIPEEPNVKAFCEALRKHGLSLLDVDPRLREFISPELPELSCSYDITTNLEDGWSDGPERAVAFALEAYLDVVRDWLDSLLGSDSLFPWHMAGVNDEERSDLAYSADRIQLRDLPEVNAALAEAASLPEPEDENVSKE